VRRRADHAASPRSKRSTPRQRRKRCTRRRSQRPTSTGTRCDCRHHLRLAQQSLLVELVAPRCAPLNPTWPWQLHEDLELAIGRLEGIAEYKLYAGAPLPEPTLSSPASTVHHICCDALRLVSAVLWTHCESHRRLILLRHPLRKKKLARLQKPSRLIDSRRLLTAVV